MSRDLCRFMIWASLFLVGLRLPKSLGWDRPELYTPVYWLWVATCTICGVLLAGLVWVCATESERMEGAHDHS